MKTLTLTTVLLASTIAFSPEFSPAIAQDQAVKTKEQLYQYQLKLDALNLMTKAIGPMVRDIKIRISQMSEFISDQEMDNAWFSFQAGGKHVGFVGLTIEQAFHTATEHQILRGIQKPISSDLDQMNQYVEATKTLVRSEWENAHKLHDQVSELTSFLKEQKRLEEYQVWAIAEAAKKLEAKKADEERLHQAHAEHAAALRLELDQAHFTHQSNSRSSDQDDYVTYDDDYYDGSYWNGYADPYYDVWGHSRVREHHEVREGARKVVKHNDWHRRAGARPHPAPSVRHPARHMRRHRR